MGSTPRCVYKLNVSQLLAPRCARKQEISRSQALESSSFSSEKAPVSSGQIVLLIPPCKPAEWTIISESHTAGPPHRSAQQDLWMCGCVESWPATQIQWTGTPQQQRSHNLHTIDLSKASSSRNAMEEARHTAGWRASWRRWRCAGLSF